MTADHAPPAVAPGRHALGTSSRLTRSTRRAPRKFLLDSAAKRGHARLRRHNIGGDHKAAAHKEIRKSQAVNRTSSRSARAGLLPDRGLGA